MKPTWSDTYWAIALACWLVSSIAAFVWAAIASAPWKEPIAWTVSWLVFVIALWWAIATLRESRTGASPEDVLRRRYADGDIDEAEYRRRMETLKDS